jgi:hypothetical protein
LQSKRAAGKSTDNKRKRKNGTSEVPCGDMPSACSSAKADSPVEAANEFLMAVTDATAATGEAGAFPDFTMVPCDNLYRRISSLLESDRLRNVTKAGRRE